MILNVMSINANGLRTKLKRDLLGKLLQDLQVGVGLITETHLRKPDLAWIKFPQYHIVADYCRRTPTGQRIGGGVLILVHRNFTTAKIPRTPRLSPIVEHCSTKIFPTNDLATTICITAIYIPPRQSKSLKMDTLKKLSNPTVDPDTKTILPHILGGDLNVTGWTMLYEEWLQEAGAMDLVNPQVPTYAGGTAIDKFIFLPGAYIPSTLLPASPGPRQEQDQETDEPFYPAQVIPYTDLSDHLPILLPIPCEATPKQAMKLRRIRIGTLSDETWSERDQQLGLSLEREWPSLTLEAPMVNIARQYSIFQRCLTRVFHREGKTPKDKEETDPLEHFLMSNLTHPDMNNLLEALELQDTEQSDRYLRRISSDGWKKYLKQTNRNDTRAMFAYLARSEGRKKWGFVPEDSTPLRDSTGRLVLTPQEKVSLITNAFRMRFSAPAVLNTSLPATDPNNSPLQPFRRPVGATFRPVQTQEVLLALSNLSEGRSPGPDGFPMELYKRLPSMRPYVVALINSIYLTGYIPLALRSIFVVPLAKPGKDPADPHNKRPISLLNSLIKILE